MRYILFCMLLIASGCNNPAHSEWEVNLDCKGKIYFVHKGFLENKKYPIQKLHNEWYWYSPDGYTKLDVPYESKFNEAGDILVLDKGGEIYVLNKDQTGREDLKIIDGVWNREGDSGWYDVCG